MILKVIPFVKRKNYISFSIAFLTGAIIVYFYVSMRGQCSQNLKRTMNKNKRDLQSKLFGINIEGAYNLFDAGAQFDTSFSPLYKRSITSVKTMPQGHFGSERLVLNADCSLLFENNFKEMAKVRKMNSPNESHTLCQQTADCEHFTKTRGFIMDPLTEEEKNFPIAYSILVYQSPEQFEILLHAIYRPQNSYCVHVDGKTAENVFNEFSCILRCFPNVYMASRRIEVNWGTISVLLPDLTCMKDLLSIPKWKYFINLTGQEFPLRTNHELVKILKIYNGSNDGEGTIKRANTDRWNVTEKPPHNIQPVKGSVHVALNRKFVEYVTYNSVAVDFFTWVNKTRIPDETFFATLIHNPHLRIPGSFKGDLETDFGKKPFLSRFVNWAGSSNFLPCNGKYVRSVCVFGVGDLPLLARRPEFFTNKFHIEYQKEALLCMDQLIYNRTRSEYFHQLEFDLQYYEKLTHIRNIV